MRAKLQAVTWTGEGTPSGLRPALTELGRHFPIREGGKGIRLSFRERKASPSATVSLSRHEATITYGQPSMALRAVGTVLSGLVAPGGMRSERSQFDTFGIMLDCSRNAVMTLDHLKGWLRQLALLGYNMVMLYTEDTYEIAGEPFFGYGRGAYSAEELKELDRYAAGLGIEMVPCIQTLAHLGTMLRWPRYHKVKDTETVMLVDEPATYLLVEKMISHWRTVFRTRRIHIGMDEAWDLGRGKYMDKHGEPDCFAMMNRHLRKVLNICRAQGYAPMIWSDMYFRLGSPSHQYYDEDWKVPAKYIKQIPKGVDLVYWDYYHSDAKVYRRMINNHRKLGVDPIMGSGVWTWSRFWYDGDVTEANAIPCIDTCRREGLRHIFFTMWGDDGGYCDFDSALAGLAMVAEVAFAGKGGSSGLARRFNALTGSDYQAVRRGSELHRGFPAPAVLWDDPLLALCLADPNLKKVFNRSRVARLRSLARSMRAKRLPTGGGDLAYLGALAELIADKIEFHRDLHAAYRKRQAPALRKARQGASRMARSMADFALRFRNNWLSRNKPFGLEVMQMRFASQQARYEELARRLGELASGKVQSIPELDLSARPPAGTLCRQNHTGLCTPGHLTH